MSVGNDGYCQPCGECAECKREASEYHELRQLRRWKKRAAKLLANVHNALQIADPEREHPICNRIKAGVKRLLK